MASKSGLGIWSSVLLLLAGGGRTLHAAQGVPASPPAPATRAALVGPDDAPDMDDVSMDDGEAGDPDDESPAQRIDALYEEGKDALDEEEWDQAIRSFDEVVRLGGERADAALYWKAYALRRSGRTAEAQAAIATLRRTAPKSKWVKEAQVLENEMRQDAGQKPAPEGAVDDETKLIALNSLLSAEPGRALPMLERFLSSNNSRKLRDKALFVLTQNDSPQARALVVDIARGQRNADLQRSAIRYLGISGGRENGAALRGIYNGAGADLDVKKAVLQAYMVSGDKENMLQVARGESSPELRRSAIQQLGAMGAQSELWQLYGSETSVEVKKAILHGMFIGGGDERLVELAHSEKNPELRRAVVRNLGLLNRTRTGPTLVELYHDGDPEVRKQVIEGLFIQGNDEALVQLARSEKDPAWRKALVQRLSLMDSEAARRYMIELLK